MDTGLHDTHRRYASKATTRSPRYVAPSYTEQLSLEQTLKSIGRGALSSKRYDLFGSSGSSRKDAVLYAAGDVSLLSAPCVAIVGTRQVSPDGHARARRLARELAQAGVTIVSGLAKGIDTAAHTGAMDNGGRTVAVIGTPLNKAYPAENGHLQESIWRNHLLISPFAAGDHVFKANFPKRNLVMAALSDATVIIEASDTSGTLHQAAECQRLGRWLFIAKSVVEDKSLSWPSKFIGLPKVAALNNTGDIIDAIRRD